MTEYLLSLFLATTSSFMHDWSRHLILNQSRVPLYERYIFALASLNTVFERALANAIPRTHKDCITQPMSVLSELESIMQSAMFFL